MVIVGSLLGGLLYQQVSAPAPFIVYAVVLGITGIIFYLLMKDS
jgi:predicted MFS family arabinose efflux permease